MLPSGNLKVPPGVSRRRQPAAGIPPAKNPAARIPPATKPAAGTPPATGGENRPLDSPRRRAAAAGAPRRREPAAGIPPGAQGGVLAITSRVGRGRSGAAARSRWLALVAGPVWRLVCPPGLGARAVGVGVAVGSLRAAGRACSSFGVPRPGARPRRDRATDFLVHHLHCKHGRRGGAKKCGERRVQIGCEV